MKKEVVVVIEAGGIGMAIARRQGFGKEVLLIHQLGQARRTRELNQSGYRCDSACTT